MRPRLQITVRGDKLVVEYGKSREEFANLIGLVEGNRILSIGETPSEIQSGSHGAPLPSIAEFKPILSVGQFDPEIAIAGIRYLLWRLRVKSAFALSRRADLSLEFPSYETIRAEARAGFETGTQYGLNLNKITINGQTVGFEPWQRDLAQATYDSVTWLCLGLTAIIAVSLPAISRLIEDSPTSLLPPIAALILMLALPLIGIRYGHLLWARMMKRYVPMSLIRAIIYGDAFYLKLLNNWYFAAAERILTETD